MESPEHIALTPHPHFRHPPQKPRTPACQYTHMGGQPAITESDETEVPKTHEFQRRTESTHFRQADIKIRPCFYACRADAKILGLAPPKPPCCWADSCVSQCTQTPDDGGLTIIFDPGTGLKFLADNPPPEPVKMLRLTAFSTTTDSFRKHTLPHRTTNPITEPEGPNAAWDSTANTPNAVRSRHQSVAPSLLMQMPSASVCLATRCTSSKVVIPRITLSSPSL